MPTTAVRLTATTTMRTSTTTTTTVFELYPPLAEYSFRSELPNGNSASARYGVQTCFSDAGDGIRTSNRVGYFSRETEGLPHSPIFEI